MMIKVVFIATAILLSGCLENKKVNVEELLEEKDIHEMGHIFSLHGCKGLEVSHEWVGPRGVNGPPKPPKEWDDYYADIEFGWALEVLECSKMGWGPLERGPLWIAIEFHNAYNIPDDCKKGIEDSTYIRFVHKIYTNDAPFLEYSSSWSLPIKNTSFIEYNLVGSNTYFELLPFGGSKSTINLGHVETNADDAADIKVSFFWIGDEKTHRLTLKRDTKAGYLDAALLNMSPPSIMADHPTPTAAVASRLSDLTWTGDLVTFSDPSCKEQVFP